MNTLFIDCTCGKRLPVRKDLAGKRVRCPSCSAVLAVPVQTPPQSSQVTCGCGQPLSVPADLRGQQVRCPKCSQLISVPTNSPNPDVADPFANLDTPAGAPSPYTPPALKTPAKKPSAPRNEAGYRIYSEVPWIRKSGTNSLFMILHMITCGAIPLLLVTCVVLVTGHVYYNQKEPNGALKVWSPANTIVAFLLLIPSIFVIGTFGVGFVGGFLRALAR
jgi:DNA-directed RNA polymerase subunit RPC12/RpoP